jgi:hypothetical protein
MTVREQLSKELEQGPESLVEEILDFCLFLKQRQQAKVNNQATETKTNGILDLLYQNTKWLRHFVFLKPLLGLVFNSQKCCHTFVNWY